MSPMSSSMAASARMPRKAGCRPTPSPAATGISTASRRAPGLWSSTSGPGWRNSESGGLAGSRCENGGSVRRLHAKDSAIGAHDLDSAARWKLGALGAPDAVIDLDAAAAVDDGRLQGELTADIALAAPVQCRIPALRPAMREAPPDEDRHGGEDGKEEDLNLPAHAGQDQSGEADDRRRRAEPDEEYARRHRLHRGEEGGQNPPVPERQRGEETSHDGLSSAFPRGRIAARWP